MIQRSLALLVDLTGSAGEIRTVCGLDVAYGRDSSHLAAAAVVLDASTLEIVDQATVVDRVRFEYRSGLFAFREMPPLLEAMARLERSPELLLCDGQGYAHPQRFGLACHIGLWAGVPSIGCAKQSLVGTHDTPGPERGYRTPLLDAGEVVGFALRTRARVKPVVVSPGHQIGFDEACNWVLQVSPRYRIPEPIRAADHLAAEALHPKRAT